MKRLILVGIVLIGSAIPTFAARGVYAGRGFGYGGVYGPYGWYGSYPLGMAPNAGYVKFETPDKQAQVFINGSYAGTVKQLGTITILSGNYQVEVRDPKYKAFQEAIFVTPGKTIKLRPDLQPL
jgi:hypothetical protein